MEKKKDLFAILIYILVFFLIYFILTGSDYLFASKIDFETQHYLIPEYFRKLFYNNFDLFPDFALNLGSGQNIYYFSYYGLLNPIVMISYIFPWIKMIDYLIWANIIIVLVSITLFYFFLKKNGYSYTTRFVVSFLLLCSGPLIFHSHRHIMFVDYMPFLILGLFGVDRYYNKNKVGLLVISLVMMIFTSYYYSVSGMVVIYIYMIYKYMKINKYFKIKDFIKKMVNNLLPFVISVMIGAVIILPTLYTLLNGRNSTVISIDLAELFIPYLSLLYDPYSIGLTIISLFSLCIMAFSKKKELRFLSIILLMICLFPFFNYILNGTLYINAKSLIPFLPIILIVVAEFLKIIFEKYNKRIQTILILYLVISSFIVCINTNLNDKLMKKTDINNELYNSTLDLIDEIIKNDDSFYRISNLVLKASGINNVSNIREYKTTLYSSTYNNFYSKFYFDELNNSLPHRNRLMTAETNNIISQILLSEKYIVTTDNMNLEFVKEKNGVKVYKNNYVKPLGYATNRIINSDDYSRLTYPNTVINLLNNIIVDNEKTNSETKNIKKIDLNYELVSKNNIDILKENNKYKIEALKGAKISVKINESMKNKILFIRFKNLINPNYDTSITINNIQNKLTNKSWKYHNGNYIYDYVIYNNQNLEIEFTKGIYELTIPEFHILDIDELNNQVDEFIVNMKETSGDIIDGDIDVKEDSYFTITIPYDKGFKIFLDDKQIEYQKVNNSFIGFKIDKGKHNIKIIYEAPYKKEAIVISLTGVIILVLYKFKKLLKNIKKWYTIFMIIGGKNDRIVKK